MLIRALGVLVNLSNDSFGQAYLSKFASGGMKDAACALLQRLPHPGTISMALRLLNNMAPCVRLSDLQMRAACDLLGYGRDVELVSLAAELVVSQTKVEEEKKKKFLGAAIADLIACGVVRSCLEE